MSDCECATWTTQDIRTYILTGHHENCPHRPSPLLAATELICELVRGIETWAADEDGVHPAVWEAYRRAKALDGIIVYEESLEAGSKEGAGIE